MIISLNHMMIRATDKTAENNLLHSFELSSMKPEQQDLTNRLKEVFWRNDCQDSPEMMKKECYNDIRWLIARLANGDSASIRHVPKDAAFYDIAEPTCVNYGYWELSLNT